MKLFTSCLFIAGTLVLANCARLQVKPAKAITEENFTGGAYYALPMATLTVNIPVTKIERTYAEKDCLDEALLKERLGLKKDNTLPDSDKPTKLYKLGDVTITGRPVPDADKVFFVDQPSNWRKNQSLNLVLNEFGVLTKADVVVEDKTFDIVVQGVQAVANIVSTLTTTKSEMAIAMEAKDISCLGLVKAQLKSIKESRAKILDASSGGHGAMPEGALKLRLIALEDLEKQLVDQITFTEERTTYIIRRDVLVKNAADIAELQKQPLFKFSKKNGLTLWVKDSTKFADYEQAYLPHIAGLTQTAIAAGEGEKAYTLFINHNPAAIGVSAITPKPVDQQAQQQDQAPAAGTSAPKPFDYANGLVYNLPIQAVARIKAKTSKDAADAKGTTVAVANLMMPQLGRLGYLPGRSATASFELNEWGGLKTFMQKSTAITGEQIAAAAGAGSSVAGLFKREAPKTELQNLETQRTVQDEQIKILKNSLLLDSLRRRLPILTPTAD